MRPRLQRTRSFGSSQSGSSMTGLDALDVAAAPAGPSAGGPIQEPESPETTAGCTFRVGDYHQSMCSICLERYTLENPAMILACRHAFHLQCLEAWRQRSRLCPVCMKPVQRNAVRPMSKGDVTHRKSGRRRNSGSWSAMCDGLPLHAQEQRSSPTAPCDVEANADDDEGHTGERDTLINQREATAKSMPDLPPPPRAAAPLETSAAANLPSPSSATVEGGSDGRRQGRVSMKSVARRLARWCCDAT